MPNQQEQWPDVLVLPTENDFCQGDWDNKNGQCCLVAWANIAFGPDNLPRGAHETENPPQMSKARRRARNRFLREVVLAGGGGDIAVSGVVLEDEPITDPLDIDVSDAVDWNDSVADDEAAIAKAWRKAASRCGYRVTDTVIIK